MRLRRRPVPILLLLLPAVSSILAQGVNVDTAVLKRDANPVNIDQPVVSNAKANPVGTKDAPVDGKDGKPHAGPFVETEAERTRKKAKESGGEEPLKPLTPSTKDQYTSDGELPQSNEGVMDDPNRVGPKEGTRGTEGGVTEKSRDSRIGEEKTPDPPKEQPPLPHGEAQNIKIPVLKETTKKKEEEEKEKKLLDVCKNPLRLRYSLLTRYRNHKIYPRNLTIYPCPKILHHPRIQSTMAKRNLASSLLQHPHSTPMQKNRVLLSSLCIPFFSLSP